MEDEIIAAIKTTLTIIYAECEDLNSDHIKNSDVFQLFNTIFG